MREFAIGDIHGCARAFEKLISTIQPRETDTIILLGDYIDRGPDSCGVLDSILDLNTRCAVIALAGNHEKMLLQARTDSGMFGEWLRQGGRATVDSYKRHGFIPHIDAIPDRHWNFLLNQTFDYWETDKHLFVHGSVDANLELSEHPNILLFWQPFVDPTIHKSGKQIVCGHKAQKSGLPAVFGGGVCIDTFAHGGGWLTCFDTVNETFTQTNEQGDQRSFTLSAVTKPGGAEPI